MIHVKLKVMATKDWATQRAVQRGSVSEVVKGHQSHGLRACVRVANLAGLLIGPAKGRFPRASEADLFLHF